MERRLVGGVAVVVFLVLNAVFVWPHRFDWSDLKSRMDGRGRSSIFTRRPSRKFPPTGCR